jgi:hypothetical protein
MNDSNEDILRSLGGQRVNICCYAKQRLNLACSDRTENHKE